MTADGPQFDARPDRFGPDPSDLPLQDEEPRIAEPTLWQPPEEPRGSSRATVVAGALVIGLLTGFTGGLLVGQRGRSLPAPHAAAAVPAPPAPSADDARPVTPFAESPAPLTYTGPTVADSSGTQAAEALAGRVSAVGRAEPDPPRGPGAVRTTGVSVDPAPPPSPRGSDRGATQDPGVLQFVSRPAGAQVFVDGVLVGQTPLTFVDVMPGARRVRLLLPGHRTWETSVTVEAGAQVRVGASLER